MTSDDLKRQEVETLAGILAKHLRFYCRLVKRMEELKWPLRDPVYRRAVGARDSVSALKTFVEDVGRDAPLPPASRG